MRDIFTVEIIYMDYDLIITLEGKNVLSLQFDTPKWIELKAKDTPHGS